MKHNRLFIIGNGFDLAHGLKTRYSDFRYFLEGFDPMYAGQYSSHEYKNPLSGTPAHTIVCLISSALGSPWCDVEAACGELNPYDCFELWDNVTTSNDIWFGNVVSSDIAYDILDRMRTIHDYLSKWLETIDVCQGHVISEFRKIINPEKDMFLTFNYTDTLEKLYGVKNVLHIHGKLGCPLIFGHGNDKSDQYDFMSYMARGSELVLSALHENLRKDVSTVIENNLVWFNELTDIGEIYSYGFSYSYVDLPYIRAICSNLANSETAVWYLNDFDKADELRKFQQRIQDSGFEGVVDTFHL